MNAITIESLGLSKDDLSERIVDRAVDRLLNAARYSGDEDDFTEADAKFAEEMKRRIAVKIDEAISQIAARNVIPQIEGYIEALCLQRTNSWGEKVGQPVTFIEYLTQRCEAWMLEDVNFEGKSKNENGGFSWSKAGTRVALLVDKHIQYSINTAVGNALKDLNSKVAQGLAETVKAQISDVLAKLTVTVKK